MQSTQELRVARLLMHSAGHPGVVHFHAVFLEDSAIYLVMEDAGENLNEVLARQPANRLCEAAAACAVQDIARALQYLQSRNIAHCDVSTENVLVRDGVHKLCDFARSTAANRRSTECAGNATYMAPEVVRAPQAGYDPVTADVWSLGVLFYIILTGSPLVELASPDAKDFAVFRLVGVAGMLCMRKMGGLLSVEAVDLLSRMLQEDPSARLASMADVLAHPALHAAGTTRPQP